WEAQRSCCKENCQATVCPPSGELQYSDAAVTLSISSNAVRRYPLVCTQSLTHILSECPGSLPVNKSHCMGTAKPGVIYISIYFPGFASQIYLCAEGSCHPLNHSLLFFSVFLCRAFRVLAQPQIFYIGLCRYKTGFYTHVSL